MPLYTMDLVAPLSLQFTQLSCRSPLPRTPHHWSEHKLNIVSSFPRSLYAGIPRKRSTACRRRPCDTLLPTGKERLHSQFFRRDV